MRFSKYFIPTVKETPADADTMSAKLMLRSGMIRKVGAGLYDWLPIGFRVLKKVERIIREEMDFSGAMEVWLPHVQPKELWEESGRWQFYGRELLRIKDRKDNDFCFAPTAEEIITDLARRSFKSYRDLPALFYQFGTKFRDEIRPRFGVMRAREFYMKDAYSFHANEDDLDATYQLMVDTYTRIFSRLGLKFRPVEADTGSIGGSFSHEFMVLAETGEEQIATCEKCGYAANIERAETVVVAEAKKEPLGDIEEVHTPGLHRVSEVAEKMSVGMDKVIKTVFLIADSQPIVALLRGDTDLNEHKLKRLLGAQLIRPAKDEEYREIAGCDVGFAGPMNLKAKVVADFLIPTLTNAVTGARKKDFHLRNVNIERDFKPDHVADIRNIRPGDPCPRCSAPITFTRGIEVGHVFKLGTKYSKSMKANILDEQGHEQPMMMGCYGIGVSRIVAAAIEQNYDEWGIRWPLPIAPFQVIVTPANVTHEPSMQAAQKIYDGLMKEKVDVLFDDRDVRAGFKFKDADLIGIPLRVTVGEKSIAKGMVEIKWRNQSSFEEILVEQTVEKVVSLLQA
ncbi:MAG: Proline--tRNA ligase [Elusimicrobia bacterium]|nr:Proline--tRNA ligase [Elusimicrobiota bacterium]